MDHRLPSEWLSSVTTLLVDAGPPNIHRWWNLGIRAATTPIVVVVNDDVMWEPGDSSAMADLDGHTMSMPTGDPQTPGWCYGLDRRHGIIPDERYTWFFGDDDLVVELSGRTVSAG